jgi:hypothetical protein
MIDRVIAALTGFTSMLIILAAASDCPAQQATKEGKLNLCFTVGKQCGPTRLSMRTSGRNDSSKNENMAIKCRVVSRYSAMLNTLEQSNVVNLTTQR